MRPDRIMSFRDLEVWQEAMALAEHCYRLTAGFPKSEQFGLTAQLRRAVVSIASNIAEGHARRTRPSYVHYLHVALGSQAELETQIELAVRLRFVTEGEAAPALEGGARVGRFLHGLIRALEQKPQSPAPRP